MIQYAVKVIQSLQLVVQLINNPHYAAVSKHQIRPILFRIGPLLINKLFIIVEM